MDRHRPAAILPLQLSRHRGVLNGLNAGDAFFNNCLL
jgi:hypothetical protein